MNTKFCHKCSSLLPIESFGKNRSRKDGLNCDCKSCRRAYENAYRAKNGGDRGGYKARMEKATPEERVAIRAKNAERQRAMVARNPEYAKAQRENKKRLYRNRRKRDPELRAKDQERVRQSKLKNPDRVAARSKVAYAVRTGRLTRQPCEICGNSRSHGHHEDYSKPLEVKWLCATHHGLHHARSI